MTDTDQPLGEYPPIDGGIAIKEHTLEHMEFHKPCETPIVRCEEPATAAVWTDHHAQGCDYSGFRCEQHRINLEEEVKRHLKQINSGIKLRCLRCGQTTPGGELSEHFRWVRL